MLAIQRHFLSRLQSRLGIEPHEIASAGVATAFLFVVLCSYYMIRPIRETLAAGLPSEYLSWLFTATFVAMLVINPLFGWVASHFSRRKFVPAVYWFFIANLIVFAFVLHRFSGTMASAAFYVWISVFNYIAVSLFWSFMADVYTNEQSRRLFGYISTGGTLGAIAGPILSYLLVERLGISWMLVASAGCFCLVPLCLCLMNRCSTQKPSGRAVPAVKAIELERLGGSMWAGFSKTFSSQYLLGIGIYMLLGSLLGSLIYVEQARLVRDQIPTATARAQFFSRADLAVNVLALILELFVARPMFARGGLTWPLLTLPLIGLVGVPLMQATHIIDLVAVLLVVRRACEYALVKPAREVLFTVVSREDKYKAKNFIDTVLARGGDTLGSWIPKLADGMNMRPGQFWEASVPIAALFGLLGYWLARRQDDLRTPEENAKPDVEKKRS